ncbi:HesB/YadR/YfhF family protein [Paenibacillus marinisediminis]
MQLKVTPAAAERFKTEWGFEQGDDIRIFVRYSGFSKSGPYSFGIMKDSPREPATMTQTGGLTFYMEQNDLWFLDEKELTIDEEHEEIVFLRGTETE